MSAVEMFEKLGYQEIKLWNSFKVYRKIWDLFEDEEELFDQVRKEGKLRFRYIEFTIFRDIDIDLIDVDAVVENGELKGKEYGEAVGTPQMGTAISFLELQAINKQVEELGWNNE